MNKVPKHCTASHNKSAPVSAVSVGSEDDDVDVVPAAGADVVVGADVLASGSFLDAGRFKHSNTTTCGYAVRKTGTQPNYTLFVK